LDHLKKGLICGYSDFFFGFEETSPPRKAHFVGPGERVKPRLSQALTRDARPDSNSRPPVQISNLCHHATPLGDVVIVIVDEGNGKLFLMGLGFCMMVDSDEL